MKRKKMKKNYNAPVQKKGRGRMTNYKIQITNKVAPFGHIINAFGERDAHELHELIRNECSYGLHRYSFKLQTVTALIKSFYGGGMRKAQSAGRKANTRLTLCAKRRAQGEYTINAVRKAQGAKRIHD